MITPGRHCMFWHSFCVFEKWTWVIYISNVLSIKTILFDILDFWCQLVVIRNVACSFHSWKFQCVDYYTAWSNSTKFVQKRDLTNHGQTCGHRFADVSWRIFNPTLNQAGDTKPVDFEPVPCRTRFANLAPKSLYHIILLNFFLVLVRIINYLFYFLKPVLLPVSGLSKT